MNRRHAWILALIVLAAGTLSFFMLTRGHPWWDDFASYLMQARAILSWSLDDFILHNTFTIQNSSVPPGPVAYPWGFPLLLAPVIALFGLNTLALKLVGVGFYTVFLIIFYFLARTRLEEKESLLLTGLLALNPTMLLASDLILSDLPFLAFSTIGLFLADGWSKKSPGFLLGLALGFSIFFSAFLRTNGILLLIPLAVSLLVSHWPDWKIVLKQSVLPLGSFAALFIVSSLIFPNGQDSYLSHFSMFTWQRLLDNILFYLWLPSRMFELLPAGIVLYPVLAIFLLISIYFHWKRDLALLAYSLATLGLFILWPERQGLRFIYPILPILLILAFDGLKLVLSRLPALWQTPASRTVTGFWIVLLTLSLGVSVNQAYVNMVADRAINGPFDEYSYDLYEYIRDETPADAVIIFVRPRALRLFTNRDSFTTDRCADLIKGDYVAIHEKMGNVGQIAPDQITACTSVTLEPVFNNKRFSVYRINP